MNKKIGSIVVALFLMCVPFFTRADELTHAIGTTGYMIQEAMWAGANRYSKQDYSAAVVLQHEAKSYMRGTHPKGRNKNKAIELTKEAYVLAKKSRDFALQKTGKKVSN